MKGFKKEQSYIKRNSYNSKKIQIYSKFVLRLSMNAISRIKRGPCVHD